MTADVTLRLMTAADIPAGARLRELAGWNQTEADWHRFLDLEPAGCFVACRGERVCGTVTTLRHGARLGWIGMVLTDPADRRQGIGTRLLERGIERLEEAGIETLKLDATPMGRPIYLERGFADEYGIERWEGIAPASGAPALPVLGADEFERVSAWDRDVFGEDRRALLCAIWQANPRYCASLYRRGDLVGYTMGRAGARAHYLGPWVARDPTAAEVLLGEFLARLAGQPVYADVCLANPAAAALVREHGFSFQRTLTRMFRGPNRHPGTPELVCGIAGPELG